MTYISADMRRLVIDRANNCCEYCRLSQDDSTFSFQIDHIISEKHGGQTTPDNLSLSCPHCNAFKGSDIASIDRDTDQLTLLYNPRTRLWHSHFYLNGPLIEALTPEGRVTVRLLQFNHPRQVAERIGLITLGRYPCLDTHPGEH
jgi:hypothetical protein